MVRKRAGKRSEGNNMTENLFALVAKNCNIFCFLNSSSIKEINLRLERWWSKALWFPKDFWQRFSGYHHKWCKLLQRNFVNWPPKRVSKADVSIFLRADARDVSFRRYLWWPIYDINSVYKTKLSCKTTYRRSNSFLFRNFSSFIIK